MNFARLLKRYAIPLTIKTDSGKDSGYRDDAGEWHPNLQGTELAVNEPLIPVSSGQITAMQEQGGVLETYDAEWYSTQPNIAVGTIVKDDRTGREYEVRDCQDYQGYSQVMIYELKAVKTIEH